MKLKKRILALVLTLCFVIALQIPVMATEHLEETTLYAKQKLSLLTPDECMDFLSARGFSLPEKGTEHYETYKEWLKEHISEIEASPATTFPLVSCSREGMDIYEAVRVAVLQYYELPLYNVHFFFPDNYEFLATTKEERQIILGEIKAPRISPEEAQDLLKTVSSTSYSNKYVPEKPLLILQILLCNIVSLSHGTPIWNITTVMVMP